MAFLALDAGPQRLARPQVLVHVWGAGMGDGGQMVMVGARSKVTYGLSDGSGSGSDGDEAAHTAHAFSVH